MSIARNLEYAMIRHDINAAQLAYLTGVTKTAINKYCAGSVIPADEIIAKLAQALNEPFEKIKPVPRNKRAGKLTVAEAAELMGKSPQWVRLKMQMKLLPESFGIATQNANGIWNYYISPKGFTEYTGIEVAM